ncbi:stearoyl-CoA 9-desaturase [Bacteriovorax sp. BSW11_IV]|uniref:acyl-CoA desaturase n=1 Tax=Bacteriovorax sp. BSW11_IV TaxID=1353529 RepID=UPI00038A1462|nr:acyl-CoA desaturase [Bacteriovorax sp. BSW11_IV]EQC48557.1 stearoyl-CoA 9-desaturase [Bacteriovorax sp. BSW11_IV]
MVALYLLILHWFSSLFCQSFFLHRYCAHKMFTMSKFWERFFYLLTFICQGSSFLNPRSYSILHQKHHAHSDTPKDPHSPDNHKNIMDMMIHTYKYYHEILNTEDEKIDKTIEHHYPSWKSIDDFSRTNLNVFVWPIAFLILYIYLEVHPLIILFAVPIHSVMGPIQGAIVNWFGHNLGRRNYDLGDNSRNTLIWDIPLMGELYQNNHHYSCQKINFAHKWYEFDPTFFLIRLLDYFKIIKIKRSCL